MQTTFRQVSESPEKSAMQGEHRHLLRATEPDLLRGEERKTGTPFLTCMTDGRTFCRTEKRRMTKSEVKPPSAYR